MFLPEVRREERKRFAYAVGAFMCVASAALIARTIGDTIYLTRFGSSRLALLYVGTAVIIATLWFAYARFVSHWPVARVITVASILLIAGCVALRLGLYSQSGALRVAIYFFAEVVIRLPALLFWTYVTLLFNPRETKRMVGLIGAGGTLACIAAGAVIPVYVRTWGTANLLWLVTLLIATFAILVHRSETESRRPPAVSTGTTSVGFHYYAALLGRDQVRRFAALIAVASFALIVNDFVFKSAARAHFTGHELAAFFGSFYSVASIAALILQLFVVHQVLARGGLGVALRVLPAVLLVASIAVAATGSFGSIVAAKFVEPFLDFTINAAAIQILYLGIAKQSRQQVRAFIDGVARPFAVAAAGGAILLTTGLLSARQLEGIVALTCGVWIWIAKKNYAAYTQGLSESIGARRFDLASDPFGLTDPAISAHVRKALRTAPDEDIPYVLALLTYWSDTDWTPEYRTLLDRDSSEVKVHALEFLAGHGDASDIGPVTTHLRSADVKVRRAAVRAVAALDHAACAPLLWERIRSDTDPRVRAAAAAELINYGDLDDLIEAATAFRNMVASSDQPERVAAAQSIGFLEREAMTSSLRYLLDDRDAEVQLVALNGVLAQPSDALIEPVARLVRDPRVGWKAAQTLVAFGPRALDALRHLVAETTAAEPPPRYAFLLPGVLAQIGSEGVSLLANLMEAADLQLQHMALRAFCDVARHQRSTARDESIDRFLGREITRAAHALAARDELRNSGADLLVQALDDEYRLHVDAVLHLLQLHTPDLEPTTLLDTLLSGSRRAEALELLDNLIAARWKAPVLSLFETDRQSKRGTEETLRTLFEKRASMWVTIAAIHAIAVLGLQSLAPLVRDVHANHVAAHVRETAAAALATLDGEAKLRHTGADHSSKSGVG